MKKMFYFNNQKGKIRIKQKYIFLYFKLIIVLLKIAFSDLINSKNTRKLKNYFSEIHLVIQVYNSNSKPKSILNDEFYTEPDEVLINGNLKECKKKCNLQYGRNNITLRFENQIESCEKMFLNLNNIIEVDLSKFDTSKITTMLLMLTECSSLEKINFGNINTSSVENMAGLFYGCSKLTSIDLSNLDISNVKTMEAMFYECSNLEKINFGNIKTSSVENMEGLFAYCASLTSIDLSNLDISNVKTIVAMFYECSSLEKINFGNINTSSVENMGYLFYGCSKLTTIDLSNFDTSNVKTMEAMFYECTNLKYLDLSNFNTQKLNTILAMFYKCESLLFLNLKLFKLYSPVNISYAFNSISSNAKYCIQDDATKNYLIPDKQSNCDYDCFKENIKIDLQNNECIETCLNHIYKECFGYLIYYKYEYNNICYDKCPMDTYPLFCNGIECNYKIRECFDKTPEFYYLDKGDQTYKKCFETCKFCYGERSEESHNCKECIDGYIFLDEKKFKSNCFKKCDFYYYFDKFNKYNCTKGFLCPEEYNKLVIVKNKCIDDCKNDDSYPYEYNNTCFKECPYDTYLLKDNKDKICYKEPHIGYYLDNDKLFKKCHETCYKCKEGGDDTYNNCEECKENYSFYNNSKSISNCYPTCNNYYYFDETNKFYCKETCRGYYNKIIEEKKICIDDCKKDRTYKYEFNNTCYSKCPNGTYTLEDNKDNLCYDHIPDGYYLDKENETFKRCYESCYKCEEKGNKITNNCKECKSNYTFYTNLKNISNCYPICEYYYYFDESNNFHCNKTCPDEYNKLIVNKSKCIDRCENDDIYKYEYNNTCYSKCPKGTYKLEDDNYYCYDEAQDGYYLDLENQTYKKCYNTCDTCDKGGNESNHNCLKCIEELKFYSNSFNISNCYPICNNYHYFDESNKFYCVESCPKQYKKIEKKKKCINDCKKDDTYKYEYNNFCLKECPIGSFHDENEYICYKIKNIGTTIINEFNNKSTNKIEDERDKEIENFRGMIKDFNVSENKDIIKTEGNVQYQMTTSDNQKNNTNKNMSTIDLGMCEDKLKTIYGIDKSLPLIIFKIDYFSPDTLIPIIGYEIYHPLNKSKLDLKYCEDILIKLNIPVTIDEDNLFKYDPNSEYYNDNCFSYTTENGTDIILNDRKQEFVDNNLSLCENNCNYTGYIKEDKQSSCNCVIKNKMDLISEIIENPNKLSNNFATEESSSISGSSNIVSIKCTKALFSKEGLKNNISSYILLIFIGQFLLSIILFMKCGYPLLVNNINEIINEKEKIQKEFTLGNQAILPQKGKRKKKKKKSGRKKKVNYPPKKYSLNFFNNNLNLSKINNNNINKRNKKNLDTDLIDENNNKNKNDSSIQKIISKIKIVYTDYELNNFEYKYAILHDKRSFGEYYCSLIKEKNIILFSFCPRKDYNSIIIRSSIFSLSFSIYYAVNFAFFTDEILHKIYEDGGKYDVLYFLPEIIISFVISYYLTAIIKLIFLSERNIAKVRQQSSISKAYYFSEKARKNLVIKYIIYFILGLGFLFLFWMLLSSFGAVYPNTQMFIFKNALISFAMALVYPFFIYIFPCVLRMCSLNSSQKDNECVYKISKYLQIF